MIDTEVYCYSQRLLNPYRGIMNVISVGDDEAVTIDGVNWVLYLRDSELHINSYDAAECEILDIRYGTWSEKQGLRRGPLLSTQDVRPIEAAGQHLLAIVKRMATEAPFPLRDHYELWLMDRAARFPLALLNSVCDPGDLVATECPQWMVSGVCRETFRSQTLSSGQACSDAEYFSLVINEAAGESPKALWIYRSEDGAGRILANEEGLPGEMDSSVFPELLVSSDWEGATVDDVELAREFCEWQAPWLLLMQQISDETRGWLEPLACRQAETLASQYYMYPKILDQDRIKAALVEAVLRSSRPGEGDSEMNSELSYQFSEYCY